MTAKVSERYTGALRELSDRLVEAQRPIRILDAINWDDSVRKAFLAADEAREKGVVITSLTPTYVRELYSLRGALETFAVRLGIERDDPKDVAQLRAIVDKMRAAAANGDPSITASAP